MLTRFARNLKISVFIVLGMLALLAYSEAEAQKASAEASAVEASQVCMVNDSVMGKPQIPVAFEGKTYYGCCDGCVERLKTDRSARYSRDPVTGREVDKATAFIVEGPRGEALYFESAESAAAHRGARK